MEWVKDFGAVFFGELDSFDEDVFAFAVDVVDFAGFVLELSAHDFGGVSFAEWNVAALVFLSEFFGEVGGEECFFEVVGEVCTVLSLFFWFFARFPGW